MWNMECMITPVITGATVVVTKDLKRNLEAAPGRHSIDSLQKAINGTSHVVRRVLQKPEQGGGGGGPPMVQEEKYQGEKSVKGDSEIIIIS